MIRKKIILLSTTLVITLSSLTPIMAGTLFIAGFQKPKGTPFQEPTLTTTNAGTECINVDNSTSTGWNSGEICLAPDIASSATNYSAATGQQGVVNLLPLVSSPGAECISAGGSTEATGTNVGICIASDLSTSETDIQHFSFKNGLPATGLQFLQASFVDGSILTSSVPISGECLSPDGSPSLAENGNENSAGFCMISSLKKSMTDLSVFSMANALPMANLQFLQVKFADSSALGGSSLTSNTECLSVGGSTAKAVGGFCLASDLSTSTGESANFTIAQNTPVTDLQFLQVSFKTDNITGPLSPPGLAAPIGAECISEEGSIAVTENPAGFCLVSDLSEATGSSTISVANHLPVSSLQFLQVKFTVGSSPIAPPPRGLGAPIGTECVSDDGSIAATGNVEGFCLVSDLINPTIGLANFSIANDLPVLTWEFLQIPSEEVTPLGGATHGAPVGVIVSDFIPLPFYLRTLSSGLLTPYSSLADIAGNQMRYFHLSNQTNGMEADSTPYWHTYPHIGLWVGR